MAERQLLIERKNERLKITIPEKWKVTFGPLSSAGYREGNALRIYESEKQQRACFVDVVSFRDLSIPVQRETVQRHRRKTEDDDGKGATFVSDSLTEEGRWEDSDVA